MEVEPTPDSEIEQKQKKDEEPAKGSIVDEEEKRSSARLPTANRVEKMGRIAYQAVNDGTLDTTVEVIIDRQPELKVSFEENPNALTPEEISQYLNNTLELSGEVNEIDEGKEKENESEEE